MKTLTYQDMLWTIEDIDIFRRLRVYSREYRVAVSKLNTHDRNFHCRGTIRRKEITKEVTAMIVEAHSEHDTDAKWMVY